MSAAAEIPEVLRLEAVAAGLDDVAIARAWSRYSAWVYKTFGPGADYSLRTWRKHIEWARERESDRIPAAPQAGPSESGIRAAIPVQPVYTFSEWMRAHELAEVSYQSPEMGLWAEDVYRWWCTLPNPKPDGWSLIWEYAADRTRAKPSQPPSHPGCLPASGSALSLPSEIDTGERDEWEPLQSTTSVKVLNG